MEVSVKGRKNERCGRRFLLGRLPREQVVGAGLQPVSCQSVKAGVAAHYRRSFVHHQVPS